MRTYLIPVLGVLLISLTACGSSSGGGDDQVTSPPSTSTLGSRAMPGSTVTVTTQTAITAGEPASVLISAPGLPEGATVAAAVGVDRESATAVTVTALASNQWRAALTLPNPLTVGTCVLVMVTLPDGSVLESGKEDFVLVR